MEQNEQSDLEGGGRVGVVADSVGDTVRANEQLSMETVSDISPPSMGSETLVANATKPLIPKEDIRIENEEEEAAGPSTTHPVAGASCDTSKTAGRPNLKAAPGNHDGDQQVKFKKLKLSHRKYRRKSETENTTEAVEDVEAEMEADQAGPSSSQSRDSDANQTTTLTNPEQSDSSDSDEVINLVDDLRSSSSSDDEVMLSRRMITRRIFNVGTDSSASDQDEPDEEEMAERHTEQQREEEAKLTSDVNTLLDKPLPCANLNIYRDFRQYQMGGRSGRCFRNQVYSSVSLVQRFELQCKLVGHEGCVNALNFNIPGNKIASGSDDLVIIIWDWERRKKITSFTSGHRENVFQSKFLPGDLLVTSCSRDGQVRLAQLCPAGSLRATSKLAQHRGPSHKMTLADDQYLVLSAGEDGKVISVDTREQKADSLLLLKDEKDKKIPIYSIHNNPMKTHEFCTAGRDTYIRVFDRRYLSDTNTCPVAKYSPDHLTNTSDSEMIKAYITSAVFNYSGEEVLGSYNDEDIYMFETHPGTPNHGNYSKRFRGHRNDATVKGVNYFGPKGEFVISGSDCGNIFFWSKETEAIVNVIHGDDNGVVNVLECHPTVPVLATSGLDEEVKIFMPTMPMYDWEDSARDEIRRNYRLKAVKKNLREKAQKNDSSDPVYGNLLWQLWRNIARSDRRRARANAGEGLQEEADQSDHDSSDGDEYAQGINCTQS